MQAILSFNESISYICINDSQTNSNQNTNKMRAELNTANKYLKQGDFKAIATEHKVSTSTVYNVMKGKSTNQEITLAILSKAADRKRVEDEIRKLSNSLQI